MSEQPALKDDAVASFVRTLSDLVKAERERDVALRLHVEDHARIDALLAERDRARDVAVKLEQAVDHLGARLLLNAIYPENQPPVEGAPRWDEDPIVLRFGWLADRCGRCGEELKAETVAAERERDAALATLARVRALVEGWGTELDADRCPSCRALLSPSFMSTCDHVEGYHHALSDIRAALEGP